ncbi:hypothetical protein V8E54_014900 [Elaphomyces granulatus]
MSQISAPTFARGQLQDATVSKQVVNLLAFCQEFKLSNKVSSFWGGMSPMQQAELGRLVHDLEPRLLDHFEGGWATDWTLKRLIDQRVADVKRAARGAFGNPVVNCQRVTPPALAPLPLVIGTTTLSPSTKHKTDGKRQSKGKRLRLDKAFNKNLPYETVPSSSNSAPADAASASFTSDDFADDVSESSEDLARSRLNGRGNRRQWWCQPARRNNALDIRDYIGWRLISCPSRQCQMLRQNLNILLWKDSSSDVTPEPKRARKPASRLLTLPPPTPLQSQPLAPATTASAAAPTVGSGGRLYLSTGRR